MFVWWISILMLIKKVVYMYFWSGYILWCAHSVASAPGKVLMTGGYLILERPNAGLVLSTNARFFAIVKPLYDEIKPDSWAWVSNSCDFVLNKLILLSSDSFSCGFLYCNGGVYLSFNRSNVWHFINREIVVLWQESKVGNGSVTFQGQLNNI